MAVNEQLQAFSPEAYKGVMAPGLPEGVINRARSAAWSKLFGMPRYDRTIGSPEEQRGIEFWPSRNAWHEYIGGMGATMTVQDVALTGALTYMSDTLGVGYFRFGEELSKVASGVADEYNKAYPVTAEKVMLEPGY